MISKAEVSPWRRCSRLSPRLTTALSRLFAPPGCWTRLSRAPLPQKLKCRVDELVAREPGYVGKHEARFELRERHRTVRRACDHVQARGSSIDKLRCRIDGDDEIDGLLRRKYGRGTWLPGVEVAHRRCPKELGTCGSILQPNSDPVYRTRQSTMSDRRRAVVGGFDHRADLDHPVC